MNPYQKSSLLGLIAEYDQNQQAYIAHLEASVETLRQENNELTSLLMSSTAANERKTLQLIMAGAFDKKPVTPEPEPELEKTG